MSTDDTQHTVGCLACTIGAPFDPSFRADFPVWRPRSRTITRDSPLGRVWVADS